MRIPLINKLMKKSGMSKINTPFLDIMIVDERDLTSYLISNLKLQYKLQIFIHFYNFKVSFWGF